MKKPTNNSTSEHYTYCQEGIKEYGRGGILSLQEATPDEVFYYITTRKMDGIEDLG